MLEIDSLSVDEYYNYFKQIPAVSFISIFDKFEEIPYFRLFALSAIWYQLVHFIKNKNISKSYDE